MSTTTTHIKHTSPAFDQWIAQLEERFGADEIYLRETGANGWSSLGMDENRNPTLTPHQSGPHWVDASPRRRDHPWKMMGRLFGTFNCTTDTGKLYG